MSDTEAVVNPLASIVIGSEALVYSDPEPTRLYELRVLDGCPKQTINVGAAGATFSKFAGNPALDAGGNLVGRLEFPRQRLTAKQVALIVEYVKGRRVIPTGGTANVYPMDHPSLKGQPGVRPLAEYLSLRPVSEAEVSEPEPVSMAGK